MVFPYNFQWREVGNVTCDDQGSKFEIMLLKIPTKRQNI